MPIMTLEEAQNKILELETKVSNLESERDTLSQNNETLTNDLKNARDLNQRYYERLNMGTASDADDDEPEETPPTCEEFASKLNII
jgi:outer membrane murein-binding lipoprotein Lpp